MEWIPATDSKNPRIGPTLKHEEITALIHKRNNMDRHWRLRVDYPGHSASDIVLPDQQKLAGAIECAERVLVAMFPEEFQETPSIIRIEGDNGQIHEVAL